jgi:hypothetical protein
VRMASELAAFDGLPESVTVHVSDVESLLGWADHASHVSTVVIAPVELHRRNLKLRLTDANLPLDVFEFCWTHSRRFESFWRRRASPRRPWTVLIGSHYSVTS